MFILTQLEEDVRIQPSDLSLPPLEAVTDVIERRFLDKVCEGLRMHASPHASGLSLPQLECMQLLCDPHVFPCTPMHPQAPPGTPMHRRNRHGQPLHTSLLMMHPYRSSPPTPSHLPSDAPYRSSQASGWR